MRLNARLAPGIYRGLMVLQRRGGALSLVPEEEADPRTTTIDWIVRMRRLPQEPTRRAVRTVLLLIAGIGAPLAQAQGLPPPGRLLASNCFQCHGTHGAGPGFESLAGKSADKLYKELQKLRTGKERDGLMAKHALGYSEDQLREIVQWLSHQPKKR